MMLTMLTSLKNADMLTEKHLFFRNSFTRGVTRETFRKKRQFLSVGVKTDKFCQHVHSCLWLTTGQMSTAVHSFVYTWQKVVSLVKRQIAVGVVGIASNSHRLLTAVNSCQLKYGFLSIISHDVILSAKTGENLRKTKAKTLFLRIINIMLRQARKVKRYNRYLGAFKDRADILYLAEYIFQVQEWEEAKRKAKENIRLHQFGSARMNSSEPTEDPAEYIFQVQEWEDLKQQAKASQLSGLKNQNSIPI